MSELQTVLTETERTAALAGLLELLSWQLQRYTAGESSSVPIELAQELLHGLCCCLGVSPEPDGSWKKLPGRDLRLAYAAGVAETQTKLRAARKSWEYICTHLPPVENVSMTETLQSLGWRQYDIRFFAHRFPCSIDYQLALPVEESVEGVDYIALYLQRLGTENAFLRRYTAGELLPLLRRYCPDYRGQLINLYEPVLTNALARKLLELPATPLLLRAAEGARLAALLETLRPREIEQRLRAAAETLLGQGAEGDYAGAVCESLAVRAAALRDVGGLGGLFLQE